jgi:hypothetical protein
MRIGFVSRSITRLTRSRMATTRVELATTRKDSVVVDRAVFFVLSSPRHYPANAHLENDCHDLGKKNAPEMQRILGGLRIPTSFRERSDHVDRINASVRTQSSGRSKPHALAKKR